MLVLPSRLPFADACAVAVATTFKGDEEDQKKDLFYTTSFSGGSAELVAIKVSGSKSPPPT
jgi:hypothetical protein